MMNLILDDGIATPSRLRRTRPACSSIKALRTPEKVQSIPARYHECIVEDGTSSGCFDRPSSSENRLEFTDPIG